MTSSYALADPLTASVLVLNRFYAAIHVVNVRRAFGLLFRDLAEVEQHEVSPHRKSFVERIREYFTSGEETEKSQ